MSRTKQFRGKSKNRGGKKGGSGGRGGKTDNQWRGQTQRQSFAEVKKENERLERYYNTLNIVPEGEEREQFWAALKRELPNSFRFCGSKGHALEVQRNLTDRYIPQITAVKFNDEFVEAPQQLPWFPSGLAWQMTTPKNIVRKFPPFAAFQKYLVSETSVGNISRQEAVSMIPPLLMDIEPHHTVLDLCAAPGSKSAQLIEALHVGEETATKKAIEDLKSRSGEKEQLSQSGPLGSSEDDGRATGLLIANDMNYTRAQMLVHQVKRLNSPNLIVTNHDATLFPSIELPATKDASGKPASKWLKFDRILADVPCSGDGTVRKNPNIWKDWIPGNGLGLHMTQVRILVRSLQMLKAGGRVVYSTCSMNPIENEAVISSAIERCGGLEKVEIVDCSDRLPGLKRKNGLKDWSVMDKEGRIWKSWADVEDAKAKKFEASLERFVPGMFPQAELPLDRCMRVYAHQQDTGGFFITVLEKKSEIRAKPESAAKNASTEPSIISVAKEIESKPASDGLFGELKTLDEFIGPDADKDIPMDGGNTSAAQRQNKEPIEIAAPTAVKREAEEGDSDAARIKRARVEPDEVQTQIIGEPGQTQHWPPPPTNAAAYPDIAEDAATTPALLSNGNATSNKKSRNTPHEEPFKYLAPSHPELQQIFNFYDLPPRFPADRFMVRNATGEPAKAIYYTTSLAKAILTTNEGKGMKFVHSGVKMFVKQDAQGADTCRWRIQTEGLPIIQGWVGERRTIRLYKRSTLRFLLKELFPKVSANGLDEIKQAAQEMDMGCSVMHIEPSEGPEGFSERITLPFWRSAASVNLMLPKEDRKAMLLRIYNDDTELIDHAAQRKADKTTTADSDAATPVVGGGGEEGVAAAAALLGNVLTAEAGGDGGDEEGEGGVKLVDDADGEVDETIAGVDQAGVGSEVDALAAEDRLRAEQQGIAERAEEVAAAPEREGEGDEMNTTV